MAGWRLARSLVVLRAEVNEVYPDRPIHMDGTIGDAAHSSRKSDHNPNAEGVVCAWDCTEFVVAGVEMNDILAEFLRAEKDDRVKYVIGDGRMFSSYGGDNYEAWEWRHYGGPNKHTGHLHISVWGDYDNLRPWGFNGLVVPKSTVPVNNVPLVPAGEDELMPPELKEGNQGQLVRNLQGLLIAHGYPMERVQVDGIFGPTTEGFVRRFQTRHRLTADGIVGPNTWRKLLGAL